MTDNAINIKLIVGLGNPGKQYEDTRHNVGALFVQRLAYQHNAIFKNEPKFFAAIAKIQIKNRPVTLMLPNTYMNLSGRSVVSFANFYQLLPSEILIAHDELDLPVKSGRLKFGGGHGGHNGLKDIISRLANQRDFYRLRIGIDHPGDKAKVANYVLNKPSKLEEESIYNVLDQAQRSLEILFEPTEGLLKAQNMLHSFIG